MSRPSTLLVIAAAIGACTGGTALSPGSSPAPADPAAAGDTAPEVVELRYDEALEHRDLVLRWLTLADSRCPIGVTCVWAGQLLATVEVLHGDRRKLDVELLRRVGRDPEVALAFGYELRLLGVDPHPKQGIKPDRRAYVMRVAIARP